MRVSLNYVLAALQALASAAPQPRGDYGSISTEHDATLEARQIIPTIGDVLNVDLTASGGPDSDVPVQFTLTHYNKATCPETRMENVRTTDGIPRSITYGGVRRDIQRFYAKPDNQAAIDTYTDILQQDWVNLLNINNDLLSKFNFTDLANATEAEPAEFYNGSGGCPMGVDINELYECENSVRRQLLAGPGTPPTQTAVNLATLRERAIVAAIITGTAASVAALAGGMSYAQQLPALKDNPTVIAVLVSIVAFISLTCISIANYLVTNRGRVGAEAALTIQVTANVMARMTAETQQRAASIVVPAAQAAGGVAGSVASSVTQGIQTSGRAVAENIPRAIGAVTGTAGAAVEGFRQFTSASAPAELEEIKICQD